MARTNTTTHVDAGERTIVTCELPKEGTDDFVTMREVFGATVRTTFIETPTFRTYRDQMMSALDSVELPDEEPDGAAMFDALKRASDRAEGVPNDG